MRDNGVTTAATPAVSATSSAQAARSRAREVLVDVLSVCGRHASASSSSIRTSPMSRQRRFGSFSRQRSSTCRKGGGVAAGSAVQSGDRSRTDASVSEIVAPENARRPVIISNSTQPNAQMSVDLSIGWPRACSGLMYAGVPRITPTPVISAGEVTVGDSVTAAVPALVDIERLGEPEVENLHGAVSPDLDVRGLQITMNDALFVSGLQCFSDLPRDGERFIDPDGAPRDPIRERGSVHELQHERAYAVGLFEAVNMRDVRMIEGGECFRFALEPREPFGVARERLRQDLQRHITIQLRVARAIHLAHGASADSGGDFVWAAARAGARAIAERFYAIGPQ